MTRHPRLWLMSLLTQSTYDINVLRKIIGEGVESVELVFAFGKEDPDPTKTLALLNGFIEYQGQVYEGALHLMVVMIHSWASEDVFPEDRTFIVKLEDFIMTPGQVVDVIRASISWCHNSTDEQRGVLETAGKSHRSTNNRNRTELVQTLQDPHVFHKDVPDGSHTDKVIEQYLNLGISDALDYQRLLPLSIWGISETERSKVNEEAQNKFDKVGQTKVYVREPKTVRIRDEADRIARLTEAVGKAAGTTDMHFPAQSHRWDHTTKCSNLKKTHTIPSTDRETSCSGGIHPRLIQQAEDKWVKMGKGLEMTGHLRKKSPSVNTNSNMVVVLTGHSVKGWTPDG